MKLTISTLVRNHQKVFLFITFVLFAIPIAAIAVRTGPKSKADNKNSTDSRNKKNDRLFSSKTIPETRRKYEEPKVIDEWRAFSIYHPNSDISGDSLFQNFHRRPAFLVDEETGSSSERSKQDTTAQILGARSLIPILRTAFGDQVRGSAASERDPWFLTHPTSLFNPSQLQSLCDRDLEFGVEDGGEICWKPRLSDEYLSTLMDFASDACPQLVMKEIRQTDKLLNRLVQSDDFKKQHLQNFAVSSLRIPSDKVTTEWIDRIVEESKKAIVGQDTSASSSADHQFEPTPEELYSASCQAVILSKEFYSR